MADAATVELANKLAKLPYWGECAWLNRVRGGRLWPLYLRDVGRPATLLPR